MTTNNSPEAVADAASSSAAAPYGTRSRGRNAPRPNYAEDRDIDMDFEAAPAKTAKRNSGVSLNNVSKSDGEKTSPAQSRKSLTNGAASSMAAPKDSIPGTSSFSARPDDANNAGSLRKRKQPASSTPNSNSDSGGNAPKRVFTAPPGDSQRNYFTNMVSFETTGTRLKDDQLVSDDGTVFAVNGRSPYVSIYIPSPELNSLIYHARSCLFDL